MRARARTMSADTQRRWDDWVQGHVKTGNRDFAEQVGEALGRAMGELRDHVRIELAVRDQRISLLKEELTQAREAISRILKEPTP